MKHQQGAIRMEESVWIFSGLRLSGLSSVIFVDFSLGPAHFFVCVHFAGVCNGPSYQTQHSLNQQ